jgi:repressor LexA
MSRLTRGDGQTLKFIAAHIEQHGYPPTLREICQHVGSTSTNAAACRVRSLVSKGMVGRRGILSRGLFITEEGHAQLEHIDGEHVLRRQLG